jgi:predicted dehydrogenase
MIWNGWIGTVKTVRIGVGGPARPCDLPAQEVPAGTDWDTWLGPAPVRPYHSDLCPKGVHSHFPAWRNYQEYGGGQIADMGAHHFDIAQWALKKDGTGPVQVIPPKDPKTGAGLRFVYDDGVVMIHNEFVKDGTGKAIQADCVFEGTDGTILVGRGQLEVRLASGSRSRFPDEPKRVYPSSNHKQNWLECIKSGKECICPAETGHRTATICHLGNIGYRLGRKLKWDPAKEQFVDDQTANKELSREPRAEWKV